MLADYAPMPTLAVKDLGRAREFYEGVLGFAVRRESGDGVDSEVGVLRERGLAFQTFEVEGIAWSDGVAAWGETRSVWFEDPDGNILNVETGPAT